MTDTAVAVGWGLPTEIWPHPDPGHGLEALRRCRGATAGSCRTGYSRLQQNCTQPRTQPPQVTEAASQEAATAAVLHVASVGVRGWGGSTSTREVIARRNAVARGSPGAPGSAQSPQQGRTVRSRAFRRATRRSGGLQTHRPPAPSLSYKGAGLAGSVQCRPPRWRSGGGGPPMPIPAANGRPSAGKGSNPPPLGDRFPSRDGHDLTNLLFYYLDLCTARPSPTDHGIRGMPTKGTASHAGTASHGHAAAGGFRLGRPLGIPLSAARRACRDHHPHSIRVKGEHLPPHEATEHRRGEVPRRGL